MPYLVIFKRFEIWLLLLLVTGLVIFAFQSEPDLEKPVAPKTAEAEVSENPDAPDSPTQPSIQENSIVIKEVKVTPAGTGMIVELTVAGRSTSGSDLLLDESTVSATTSKGESVPLFFEPFREPSLLLASEDSLATVRWWLESPVEAILLNVQGESIKAELP